MKPDKPDEPAGRSISRRSQVSVAEFARDILAQESGSVIKKRAALARAITLVESTQSTHQDQAQALLQELLPHSGQSLRIGISGVPGVGKSTFIDAFGSSLTAQGRKVAVLAVDPSSTRSGGSILGDKTRMQHLSVDPDAYIRPSPTSGTLGGVTRVTRETIVLCEAAGFDTIIVETVGVGQSEVSIASMVDFYCLLMLPGAGDELQGIKKGVLEIADMIAVNKADPDDDLKAKTAAADYRRALHIMTPLSQNWQPPVVTCSALHAIGIKAMWESILQFQAIMQGNGEWQQKREKQQLDWMWSLIEQRLLQGLHDNPAVSERIGQLEQEVITGVQTPVSACREVLALYAPDR